LKGTRKDGDNSTVGPEGQENEKRQCFGRQAGQPSTEEGVIGSGGEKEEECNRFKVVVSPRSGLWHKEGKSSDQIKKGPERESGWDSLGEEGKTKCLVGQKEGLYYLEKGGRGETALRFLG